MAKETKGSIGIDAAAAQVREAVRKVCFDGLLWSGEVSILLAEKVEKEFRRIAADPIADLYPRASSIPAPTTTEDSPIKTLFDHPFFRKAPAFACLQGNDRPHPDHLRACLMELVRYVFARLDRIEATVARQESR